MAKALPPEMVAERPSQSAPVEKLFWTIEEVAVMFCVSKRTMQDFVAKNPHYRLIGRRKLFAPEDIIALRGALACPSGSVADLAPITGTSGAPSAASLFSKARALTARRPPRKSAQGFLMRFRLRDFNYARLLTHSSGNMWPRSSGDEIKELLPLLRFMERTTIGGSELADARSEPVRDLARESAEHLILKRIAASFFTDPGLWPGLWPVQAFEEFETGAGRVDVAIPNLRIACECGDMSAHRIVNILLAGWSAVIVPFPKGDYTQWRRVKVYMIAADADGLADVLTKIRAARDAAMRRCADVLNLPPLRGLQ